MRIFVQARISDLASWPLGIILPTAAIGAVCLIFPSPATPAVQVGANSGSSGYGQTRKCLISSDFSYTPPSPTSSLTDFPATAVFTYPAGTASAAIRRTILPKSRRVRWLSANTSQ
jgi:hypothetical protein